MGEQGNQGGVVQAVPLGKHDGADVDTVVCSKLDKGVVLLYSADGGALTWWKLKGQRGCGGGNGVTPRAAGAHGCDAVARGVKVGCNVGDELCG